MQKLTTIYIGGSWGERAGDRAGTPIEDFETKVRNLAVQFLPACTITFGTGVWKGDIEATAVVSVIGYLTEALTFAQRARDAFLQDAVLVTQNPVQEYYIDD